MRFEPLAMDGVVLVHTDQHRDERGWFSRAWCADEFAEAGLPDLTSQSNLSFNQARHTLRGMHWQAAPSPEAKLVRAVHGAIHDVVVDLRPGSSTFGQWVGVDLDATAATALVVPAQCAHGFLTLTDNTLVHYQMAAPHAPALARGLRWDDPDVGIAWPHAPAVISDRDRNLPSWAEAIAARDL